MNESNGVWNAEAIVTDSATGDVGFWTAAVSAAIPANATALDMETNAIGYMSEQIGCDPADMDVVSVHWTT